MFITVKREMGMLITVIRYLSYVNVVNCTKAPLRGGRYTIGRSEKLTEKVGRRETYPPPLNGVILVSSFLSNLAEITFLKKLHDKSSAEQEANRQTKSCIFRISSVPDSSSFF